MIELLIEKSIEAAKAGQSKLNVETLAIRGFSTPTIRHLINNLVGGVKTYLEVGVFRGATFCAAACGNTAYCYGVDDFSQDFSEKGVEEDFYKNISKHNVWFDKEDCWTLDLNKYPMFMDVFFYDGFHSEESQAKALPHFLECLSKNFIFIVDDINWDSVKKGTAKGFETLKDKVRLERTWELKGKIVNNDPVWHNGVNIFLCAKL